MQSILKLTLKKLPLTPKYRLEMLGSEVRRVSITVYSFQCSKMR